MNKNEWDDSRSAERCSATDTRGALRKKRRLVAVAALAIATAAACAPPIQSANPAGYVGEFPSVRIVDGDTIDVTSLPSDNIRFIGIDTPETGTPCGALATEHLRTLVAGRPVTLVVAPNRDDHDGYGRPLRYVEVAGVDIGRQMIADGFAIARYDSLDGYERHPRQDDYRHLGAVTAAAC
jgi:endonuclease YncB( thermonuclease family)